MAGDTIMLTRVTPSRHHPTQCNSK